MTTAQPIALIKEALSSTVSYLNQGMNPTKALTKVAKEYDLNPHYIERVGSCLNVSLAHKHFKVAADRSSNYPIADIPATIVNVFGPQTEKTANQEKSEIFKSSSLQGKIPNYEKILYSPKYKQAQQEFFASQKGGENIKEASYTRVHENTLNYLHRLKKEAEEYKTRNAKAKFDLNHKFANFVNHFSKMAGVTEWNEIESQVFSKHGEEAVPYLDLIYKMGGMTFERGEHDPHYQYFDQCKEAKMFDDLMEAAVETGRAEENEKNASFNYDFEQSFYTDIWKQATVPNDSVEGLKKNPGTVDKVAAAGEEDIDGVNPEKIAYEQDDFIEKFALNLIDILAHKFSDSVETKNQEKSNPLANTAMDNQQRKLILQELIMTDPILSKEPPQKVVSAYQQVLRVAPELSKEKDVVRSILREMLATQALNPHTANMLTENDLNLMKQKLLRHSGSMIQGK